MNELADEVRTLVATHLGVPRDDIALSSRFVEDLKADSLDTIELVMIFEEAFACEIPDDAAESVVTVGDAVSLLLQRVALSGNRLRTRAAELANENIDRMGDCGASKAERADRKRQLVDGPDMVRLERIDRDKDYR